MLQIYALSHFSYWRDLGSVPRHFMGLVVEKVVLEWDFFPKYFSFFPITIILPMLHAHSFI